MSTRKKHDIVKTYNLIERLKEEKNLLFLEMNNYIHYFKSIVPNQLQSQINSKT